jgi:hypothetical protein
MPRPRLLALALTALAWSLLAAPAQAQHGVPFKGDIQVMTITVGATNTMPPVLTNEGVGTGNATHLGDLTATLDFQLVPAGNIPFVGTITFTAANGDTLLANFVGQYDGPTTFSGYFFFVDGGTGRFAHASGGGTLTGQDLGSVFEFEASLDGTIDYGK